jgi:uncharacterized protein (DUF3084 family)
MRVRRDEMDIHLAHAHNIGPVVMKEKGRDRHNKRRPPSRWAILANPTLGTGPAQIRVVMRREVGI